MTNHIQFEGKKHGLRQGQDGVTFTMVIHPNDVDPRLLTAPMGKVFQVVMVDPDDISTEKQEPQKKEKSLAQLAAIISQDQTWDEYVSKAFPHLKENGPEAMRTICGVKSRSEILEGTPAGITFKRVRENFYDYQKYGVI